MIIPASAIAILETIERELPDWQLVPRKATLEMVVAVTRHQEEFGGDVAWDWSIYLGNAPKSPAILEEHQC